MKKAHLNKWRQERTGVEAPDDFGHYEVMDFAASEDGSPTGELTASERQVSEISSTTNSHSGCLDLRTNVKMKVEDDDENNEALDLRTNVKREDKSADGCSDTLTKDYNEALDLRICNVVSLKDINPIPSCVPESLSDCDTSELSVIDHEQSCANDTASDSVRSESVTSESNPPIDITAPNKMLPIDIIEKFNLIRNLVIASNGLIPSNIDDPGGTKLEVAQEEIVETSADDQAPGVSRETANGYNYVLHPVKFGAFPLFQYANKIICFPLSISMSHLVPPPSDPLFIFG